MRLKDFSALPPAKLWFIEPMYARPVQNHKAPVNKRVTQAE